MNFKISKKEFLDAFLDRFHLVILSFMSPLWARLNNEPAIFSLQR